MKLDKKTQRRLVKSKVQREISRGELAKLAAINSQRLPCTVDLDGRRLQWVGIGWVDEGSVDGTEQAKVIKDSKR